MALTPWKGKQREQAPGMLAPLSELRGEIDRLFDTFMRQPLGALADSLGRRGWEPALDIAQNDREVVVRAEIPGVEPQDLEITITGNRLTIAGEKREVHEQQDKDFYHAESRYGSFERIVELPEGVDPEQVTAEHANGVLTIRLSKPAATASRRVEVRTS